MITITGFELFLFIITSVGITNIVVNGGIFESFRDFVSGFSSFLGELVNCSTCAGFWIGIFLGFYFGVPIVISGAISSLFNHFYAVVTNFISAMSDRIIINVISGETNE